MSQSITFNGNSYTIPDVGETDWGQNLTNFFVAIPQGALQKSGGSFTLTADVDFGANFGLKSLYYKSRTTNLATGGIVRLAVTDPIAWRNNANDGNLTLRPDGTDQLAYDGVQLVTLLAVQDLSRKTLNNTCAITLFGSAFALQDNSTPTKQVTFDISAISPSTTRTFAFPDASTTLVGTDVAQNLTNKTLNNTNAISITASAFTLQDGSVASKHAQFDVSAISPSTTRTFSLPNANTTLVGTDVAQNLTLKTFADAINSSQIGTPSNPSSGFNKLYPKADNFFYSLNSAGDETRIGSKASTIQTFSSGSGTYTLPTPPPLYIEVILVGGGGGGSGSGSSGFGAGGNGGDTTFSTLTGSGGGGASAPGAGGAGGSGINGDINIPGQTGSSATGITTGYGPIGGSSAFPGGIGGKSPGQGQPGGDGTANTGGGGSGGGPAGSQNGASGGGGGYVLKLISSPNSTYSYGVGAGGTAGAAGTAGLIGGAGGSGFIQVIEYY